MTRSSIIVGTILPSIKEPISLHLAIDDRDYAGMNDALTYFDSIMVHKIVKDEVWLERPNYEGHCHWVTTFKELQRIGIITDSSNIETYAIE